MFKPIDRTHKERRTGFRFMLTYVKPHRSTFMLVFICTLFGISADLLQPYLVKIVIDDVLTKPGNNINLLFIIGGSYIGLSVLSFVFTYVQDNLLQYVGQNIVVRIRKDLFRHISNLSMSFFDRRPLGTLVTNVSSDTETINQFFTNISLSLIRDGITLLLIIAMMLKLDAVLALYSMILIPVIAGIAIGFRPMLRKTYEQTRLQLSRLISFLAENLAGMNIIQVFHQEKKQLDKYTKLNRLNLEVNFAKHRTTIYFNRTFEFLGNLALAFLVWAGGMAVFNHSLEVGVLFAFITYIRQFFQPIIQITQQWDKLQSETVSMDRLWQVFSIRPEVMDPRLENRKDIVLSDIKGRVDFENVYFGYTDGIDVISNLNLQIKPGEIIGIVGETGAGKSSILNMLGRFYDIRSGSIRIDGIDIRDIPQSTLHRIIGFVQQDPHLYSGSILENVRLFNSAIPREEVIQACKFVGLDPFIQRLNQGYDTPLSERGSGLSAGERQLLSLARIVVYQPKLLILDEATAHLDSHTEQMVQNALQHLTTGRTTLVVAHRISTIIDADRIMVMKQGRIVEVGSHQELLAHRGYYAMLYKHSLGKNEKKDSVAVSKEKALFSLRADELPA